MAKKSIEDILKDIELQRINRINEEKDESQKLNDLRNKQRDEWNRRNKLYENSLFTTNTSVGSGGGSLQSEVVNIETPELSLLSLESFGFSGQLIGTASITTAGNDDVRGVVWSDSVEEPTLDDVSLIDVSTGEGVFSFTIDGVFGVTYVRAYVTNTLGTFYSNVLSAEGQICLAKGTEILLANGLTKLIEEIDYQDVLEVWNFDDGRFDVSNPLWVKKMEVTNKYNLIKFSDGSELKTISQHRIFNKERGEFTYPMTDDTPIGTTTFNSDGYEITLISKEVIMEEIEYYNIITNKHINMFANGILTSCRYNNIYPIVDMKFIKDNRVLRLREEFENISDKYFTGLRLCEQLFDIKDIEKYIHTLLKLEKEEQLV